jgi:tripartite-type tricarboxylate transporter receptor subunit TctC
MLNPTPRPIEKCAIARRKDIPAAAAACIGCLPRLSTADTWPTSPVKWVLPFPPGNGADVVARLLADRVGKAIGQPIVIDNKPGAGGMIGVNAVAKAVPDGYTFGIASISPITILPAINKNMAYDPFRELLPVALLAAGPNVIVVRRDLPVSNLKELIAYCKARPGRVTAASLGVGTISNVSTKILTQAAGIELTDVAYKGSSQALVDLLGGNVDVQNDSLQSTLTQIRAGTIKAIAVTSQKRTPLLPGVAAVSESGIAGLEQYDYYGWIGAFAPANTPKHIVSRIHKEMELALADAEVRNALSQTSLEAAQPNTPDEFRSFVLADARKWKAAATQLKIEQN